MEHLDIEGLFWLPHSPDSQIAGRLTFSPSAGGELQLIGSLSGESDPFSSGQSDFRCDRILGVAGQRLLTLHDCLRDGWTVEFPGLVRETYAISTIFAGKTSLTEPLAFSLVHIEIDHLEDWVGKSVFKETGLVESIRILEGPITTHHLKPVEPPVNGPDGIFQLLASYMYRSPSIAHKEINLIAIISIHFGEPQSYQEITEIVLGCQALVSIALDTPLSIRRILVFEDNVEGSGELVFARLEGTEVFSSFRGLEPTSSKDYYHPSEMLFTFDEIGGFAGIIQWLNVFKKYRLVVDMMTSHWYLPKLYIQNRFANALIASEALLRIEEQRQEINYHNKIKQQISRSSLFSDLVQDTASWVDEIMGLRNELVIHPGLKSEVDSWRLYILAESLYFLVVILLLKKCGVPEAVMSAMASHRRYIWLNHQLEQ